MNISAQKNIVSHAQDKISLFAAQKGFSAYAAKGKVELQAQDDAIEAIARKVIKLISTEDKIELTSPKEIVLTAGGSQLKINGDGIFTTTGGKFESKAGQHLFTGGNKVVYEVPQLPSSVMYSNKLDVYDLFWESDFSNLTYTAYMPETNAVVSGQIDEHGRTGKVGNEEQLNVKFLVGKEQEFWDVIIEEWDDEDFNLGVEKNDK